MRETSEHDASVRTRGHEDRAHIERMLTEATKAVFEAWAEMKVFMTTPRVEDEAYVLTPEGEDVIRDLIESTVLTQEAVTAAGDALEARVDAAPDRYFLNVSGRDHAVDPRALAVRDVIEANRLLGMAVAVLGHEAVDALMRALTEPVLGAAAA